MHSTEITIKTLTPLFTGGIDGTTDRLHETSIIGSLRRWYETIINNLGNKACDKENKSSNLWDVCRIFGATGQKRPFNLNISPVSDKTFWRKGILNVRPTGRNTGWYIPPGFIGDYKIRLHGNEYAVNLITSLFLFLEEWGSVGAKNQLGYGFFKITNKEEIKKISLPEQLPVKYSNLNDKLIFFKYTFSPSSQDWWTEINGIQRLMGNSSHANILYNLYREGMVPVSPVLKNYWRYEKWDAPYKTKSWLMGMSRGEVKTKSKLSISWAYRDGCEENWTIRGSAWLPDNKNPEDDFNKNINSFIELLEDEILWKKALNLMDSCHGTELKVIKIETQDEFVNFLEGGKI